MESGVMDKRRHPRYLIRGTLMAAIKNMLRSKIYAEKAIRATVMDLSREGAGLSLVIISSRPYQVGESICVDIELPDGSTIGCEAEVRWTKALPEQIGHYLGIQFVHMETSERVRLNAYLDQENLEMCE